ncbi:MAG: subclass B3 metallo-beta-lactamase [Gemmatimonadota bacterium]
MIRTVFALLAALPSGLLAQSPDWTEPRTPVRIADQLYYVGTAGLASYLFTSSEGHILIDAPLQANVPLILENIRSLGFDPADIRIQVASHAHFDHVGGLADMLEATGAELVLTEADATFVRSGRDFGLEGITAGYPPATVTRTIGHLETVRLGDLALTAHLTPGHTPGCTSWGGEVQIEGERYEFVSVCSLSVLPYYTLGGDEPTYEGQAKDYCTSLTHLESLDPDIFLGSHGSWFRLDEKIARRLAGDAMAFVEQGMYREYLSAARASIERALAEEGFAGGCSGLAAG